MIYFLTAVHIFFTVRLRFVQKHTFTGIKYSFKPQGTSCGIGTYRAFAAALGTTVGPGNIVGVALAISIGGAGSVLWLALSGFLAMSTKYAECFIAMKYRQNIGGTMITLKKLNKPYLAFFWSLSCAVGGLFMGAAVPSNSLCSAIPVDCRIIGAALCFLTILAVCFGVKAIANVSAFLVPVMSLGFTVFCLAVIVKNACFLPSVFADMVKSAFLPSSVAGGGIAAALKQGIIRGLYSNESGLGTGGVLACESGDDNIELSSLSAMTTAFWDTVVMCTVTGIMFLSTGAKKGMSPVTIMEKAFGEFVFGRAFLAVSMFLFVFATIIGWYYIARRALEAYFPKTGFYDFLYVLSVFFGAVLNLSFLWKLADAVNICILLPSLYAILRLYDKIALYRSDN